MASAALATLFIVMCSSCIAAAQTFSVLYAFHGAADGWHPFSGLIQDSAGNLYGTAAHGGDGDCGVIFKLTLRGKETPLYSFKGGSNDGCDPVSGLQQDASGNFYGTTQEGGTGCGTVYKLDPAGHETLLHRFIGGSSDGCSPDAGVIVDTEGNLYGSTSSGGDLNCGEAGGCGVVFKLSKAGKETILHKFDGADGAFPQANFLVRDGAGNLYGTAAAGGNKCAFNGIGCGVVFRLSKTGEETIIFKFPPSGGYGYGPLAGLLRDARGTLYGTALAGGNLTGDGVVFKISNTGQITILHMFQGEDGAFPYTALIQDSAGNLYGTTDRGGDFDFGAAFKLSKNGKYTVLHSFTGDQDGYEPDGRLVLDADGNLYGTTLNGGTGGGGTVYKITRP